MADSSGDDDFRSQIFDTIPQLTTDNYLEWALQMRSFLKLCRLWHCIQPKADDDESEDDPQQLCDAGIWIRRTFSEYIHVTVRTSKAVDLFCGRSLWAWLKEKLIERGIGPLARYTILYRRLRLKPGETVLAFENRQILLQRKIEASGATLTPDLESRISLYMALLDDDRLEALKTIWWHNWEKTTYPDMRWAIQDVLQREQRRKREWGQTAQHVKGNEARRKRKRNRRLHA